MTLSRLLLSTLAALLFGTAAAQTPPQQQPLRIGVTPGAIADSVETAAAEARKQGLEVKVVEFTEWTGPNTALEAGDLDANYFQHLPFLENAVKDRHYKFKAVAVGLLPNQGLFSLKYKRFADLPDGARVAIASDPANQGRGLLLLQRAGLLRLRDGVGDRGRLDDVVANPKKLKLIEIDGPQLVRSLDDVDLAQGVTSHYVAAGKADIADRHGLLYTDAQDARWAIHFVAREDNANDPRLLRFIRIYQESPAVRERIRASYANNDKFYSLPWLGGKP
ncbi:MetQ/NlpA family ABC transporter substrate-binding protein [Xylophilus sp.]|uniref:MetQ/NlpA family ABC transporter substrate-binding protein n=1 Tax=Xylophilus sp. TaxID=2653893 RepID=UPI0013BD0DF5|nr:MetQ/NlpA family ABC transporter substrate-binding protein [Xylophilus sp.]KAF1048406.1 MAG: D-methionine-binding lipoprotein MetQ [Xylophilus sp.]